MYFESLEQLLYMNGHGAYVWTAYAITWLAIAGLTLAPLRRKRKLLAAIRQRQLSQQEKT